MLTEHLLHVDFMQRFLASVTTPRVRNHWLSFKQYEAEGWIKVAQRRENPSPGVSVYDGLLRGQGFRDYNKRM